MAGFMSSPLGFASTAGAFIGGAAKQFNLNEEAQNAAEEKEGPVWAARAIALGKNIDQANQYQNETNRRGAAYRAAKDTLGSDQLATSAMRLFDANNGKVPIEDIISRINKPANYQAPPEEAQSGFVSPYLQGLQNEAQTRMNEMNAQVQNLPQRYQGIAGQVHPLDLLNQYSSNQQPSQSPTFSINPGKTAQQQHIQGALTPQDFPAGPQGEQSYNQWRKDNNLSPVAGVQTGPRREPNTQETEQTKSDIRLNEAVQKQNANDYLKSVHAARGQLSNQNEIANDADDMIRMTNAARGDSKLLASATQPLIDGVNRILSSMGMDVLQQYGLANKVSNINEASKVLARLQFGQIPNYHLGRWTEREVGMLRSMLPSIGGDPNTNIKVALLIKAGALRAIQNTNDQWDAIGGGTMKEVTNAMNVSRQQEKDLKENRLPWTQIDSRNPDKYENVVKNLQPGSWLEDISTGQMMQRNG